MENSGVTIEGEKYEVVDECIEEEDTHNTAQSKSVEIIMGKTDGETSKIKSTKIHDIKPVSVMVEKIDIEKMERGNAIIVKVNKDDKKNRVKHTKVGETNVESTDDEKDNVKDSSVEKSNLENTEKANLENSSIKETNGENTNGNESNLENPSVEKSNVENIEKSNLENSSVEKINEESTNDKESNVENPSVEKGNVENNTEKSNLENSSIEKSNVENTEKSNLENFSVEKINEESTNVKENNVENPSIEESNVENTEKSNLENSSVENEDNTNVEKINEENTNVGKTNVEKQCTNIMLDNSVCSENMEQDEEVQLIECISISSGDTPNAKSDTENNEENKDVVEASMESIDFTADINLDQLNEEMNVTNENVLQNINEVENKNTFNLQVPEQDNQSTKEDNEIIIDEIDKNTTDPQTSKVANKNIEKPIKPGKPEKVEWYENKLLEKESIIKERLSKVAKVLGISYPSYENWLEWKERVHGSPLCKLKPARRCRLDKPYNNRWKFVCNKRKIQESPNKMENTDTDATANKNAQFIWKVEANDVYNTNLNNEHELPSFVLRAVKIFEDFLQTTEISTAQNSETENFADDIQIDPEPKKEVNNEGKLDWLGLLVRCNSMDELMLLATGKNISRATMDRLKQVFESGPGKDCNVKSLYCKSLNKCNDIFVTDTTFLVGSEALDEVVGGLKIQLAPKTNFWSNTAGAENIAKAVMDLLSPNQKITVLEIGCGIGLIGLMMASKCQQIIGVDSPSEVEEAEMTCELNNIKNASFIMGTPSEVTGKIVAAVKNRKTSAIINANTNIGRAIEVMTCLRKIPSLKRIVMITTLTKQSVRAILELARPTDNNHGPPFIPIVACVVDTLPVGPHFESVILLQRKTIEKFNPQWCPNVGVDVKPLEGKNTQGKLNEQNVSATKKPPAKGTKAPMKRNLAKSVIKFSAKKPKPFIKKSPYTKNNEQGFVRNNFKGKRSHSPDKVDTLPKKVKKFNKLGVQPWHTDPAPKKKKEWTAENPIRINPLYEKKRELKEQPDLRARLSNTRFDVDIAQTVKEHQAVLEIAKEKLSGPAPTVDVNTAKQLQSMLNMVLEQTNKLQSQLPRSVWDRIAPPESTNASQRVNKQEESLLKDRYIQEVGSQDILITTSNKTFLKEEEPAPKPIYKKYNNIPPVEPNTIMPVAHALEHGGKRPFRKTSEQYETNMRLQQQTQEVFDRNRWNEMGNIMKSDSPMIRQGSPIKHRMTPPKRLSPKRPLLSPPRRPCSPPRRHFSPLHRPVSPIFRQRSPMRCQMSPIRRPMSPQQMSPSRRPLSPPRRTVVMFMNRPASPIRRQVPSSRRQESPMRATISPSRRQLSPMRRATSPPRRQIPSTNRMMSPGKQEIMLSKHQTMPQERQQMSTMRRGTSPQRFGFEHPSTLSTRPQSPQSRQISPQRFNDDWDIPSRGAIEQSTWGRSIDTVSEQNIWRNEKTSTPNNSWEQSACNDRQRKSFNQEKWDAKEPTRNETWNNRANVWNSKQMPTKPTMKDTWTSNFDNRWPNTCNMPGSSNENWNIRGKDTFTTTKESWPDNKMQSRWESANVKDFWKQNDKEDLNDLPEDAKDPWGDDGNSDLKERWLKFETTPSSSIWIRESEQGDMWSKNKDNWQTKGASSFSTKSKWKNNGVQNVRESRWLPQNDVEKKSPSSTWQSGNNMRSWQFQNSTFQSQRSFPSSQFKNSY